MLGSASQEYLGSHSHPSLISEIRCVSWNNKGREISTSMRKIKWVAWAPNILKCSRAVVPNLGSPDILGLKLPEALITSCAGQDFWELQSENVWGLNIGNHWSRGSFRLLFGIVEINVSINRWEYSTAFIVGPICIVSETTDFNWALRSNWIQICVYHHSAFQLNVQLVQVGPGQKLICEVRNNCSNWQEVQVT